MQTPTLVVVLAALMVFRAAPQDRGAVEERELEKILADAPANEVALGLDDPTRRQIQRNLAALGFNPGPADGQFGPRTRRAIAAWQASRGVPDTGYLDEAEVVALMGGGQPAVAERAAQPSAPALPRIEDPDLDDVTASPPPAPTNPEIELVFWQSIGDSTDARDFEAYLEQFPNGTFRTLAQVRMEALNRSAARAARRPSRSTRSDTGRSTENAEGRAVERQAQRRRPSPPPPRRPGPACEIPGYPTPANVQGLGLSWCASSVGFQRRAFALQAAGAWCAIAGGTSSTSEQVGARHREINAACDALDGLARLGGPSCQCPAGYRPPATR